MSFQSQSVLRKFTKSSSASRPKQTPVRSANVPPSSKKTTTKQKQKQDVLVLSEEYKQEVAQHSYLGKKGYTVPKSVLSDEDVAFLKIDLFMRPITIGAVSYGGGGDEVAFPVYRENENKMYLPRFYGIQRYGYPPKSEIQIGTDIDVPFEKPLRDYQEHIIGVYMKHVDRSIFSTGGTQEQAGAEPPHKGGGAILEVPCGRGKTIMALKIISLLRKKTLILVHKEFLMNQWIERMADFLPTAKIGKIQGQVFDVEGKDVVIGMIQTLYDKEYPSTAFDSFGLTIIDEVHRIGSEQFSKTLLKTITPYMLGISATVERKDGLTRVLYMFIGEKIYTENRENDDAVCVRAIEYVCPDPEFNEVISDFRGNPLYSSMISKLSNYAPRTEFVLRVLRDLISEQPDSQIMILAHQRSILSYINDAVCSRKIADGSIGFYVGGMKEEALKTTETKQIVLATYAMAAEALDIKTLSTLVMITPKTDIIQSVGRILRMKHQNPIVVDIVDKHDNFQKQWVQRRRFYKKCNYRIRMIQSTAYVGMELDWNTDRTWKWVYEPTHGGGNNAFEHSSPNTCVESSDEEEGKENTSGKHKPMGCMISLVEEI
jgi:superfamily II DNA or RNA helicase